MPKKQKNSNSILTSKILIIISIVTGMLVALILLLTSYFMLFVIVFIPKWVGLVILALTLLKIAGLTLSIYSYTLIKSEIKKAGKAQIIASLLPPLAILALIAGIILLVQKK